MDLGKLHAAENKAFILIGKGTPSFPTNQLISENAANYTNYTTSFT